MRRSANDEVINTMRSDDLPPNEGEGALHYEEEGL